MPFSSPHQPLDIPQCNILSYNFTPDRARLTHPTWIDAANPDKSLSMAQMLSYIKRFAVGLSDLNIPEKTPVMVFSPNHIFVPMVYLASAGSKRIFSGANPTYTASEVAYQMTTLSVGAIFVHPDLLSTCLEAAAKAGVPKSHIFLFADTRCETRNGIKDWRNMLASETAALSWRWDPLIGEAAKTTVACINFSSGTTGLPKGVCITHANLIANASQCIFNKFHGTPYSEDNPGTESWVAFLPLYHAYSQLWTINIACRLRSVPVYVMAKFVYEDFLKAIQEYKVTAIQAVPPVLVMLSKRPETKKYDLKSLNHVLVGAAPTSSELQNEVSGRFGLTITQGWGMTETTCAGIMLPFSVDDRTGSIGELLPNTEAKLVDDEGKEIQEEGERGELCVRGPQMMLEYWRNAAATRESVDQKEGWFHTGDVAITKGGRWWIVDRKKELIKVKGLQVAPAELEAVLLENPDVADAAAVGVAVADGEEWPRAYVVLQAGKKLSERDVQKWVEGKLSRHKWLVGGVKFVEEIPKLPSGKIVRKLMKEWAKRDAGEVGKTLKAKL